jgi:pSer/pThr/pTyr-binding forkhead associated (FHA) protein
VAHPLSGHGASPAELQEQIEAERAGEPFVVYRDDEGAQHIRALAAGPARVTIGRDEGLELRLAWDGEVSRLHAELELVGGHWTLADDGLSRNGSYVNGERVAGRRRLHDGDVLRFGRTFVLYRKPRPAASSGATVVSDEALGSSAVSDAQRRVLVALCRPFLASTAFVTPPTNQDIAAELFLSVEAVKTHLRLLYGKFGIEDLPQNQKRTRLVEMALVSGLVSKRDADAP